MSAKTIFTCDCCNKTGDNVTGFNNGPANKLINSWSPDSMGGQYAKLHSKHYCRSCIDDLNKAINAIFNQYA